MVGILLSNLIRDEGFHIWFSSNLSYLRKLMPNADRMRATKMAEAKPLDAVSYRGRSG